jgi:LPXTG-motif cell wall-anchored protein
MTTLIAPLVARTVADAVAVDVPVAASFDALASSGADNLVAFAAFGIATVLLGVLAVVIAARRRRQR